MIFEIIFCIFFPKIVYYYFDYNFQFIMKCCISEDIFTRTTEESFNFQTQFPQNQKISLTIFQRYLVNQRKKHLKKNFLAKSKDGHFKRRLMCNFNYAIFCCVFTIMPAVSLGVIYFLLCKSKTDNQPKYLLY